MFCCGDFGFYLAGFGPDGWIGREGGRSVLFSEERERQIGGGGGKMEPNLASDVAQKATGLRQQGLRVSAPQMPHFLIVILWYFCTSELRF